jgi:ATP-binding cassette subfamily B (MDR/TAP) protein 1
MATETRPELKNALSRVFSRVRIVKAPKVEEKKEEVHEVEAQDEPISFFLLFKTADAIDKIAVLGALIGAVTAGAILPSFSILFGEFTNAFGNPSSTAFMDVIKDLSLKFLYLGIGAGVADFLSSTLWTWSGNRQANRIRGMYLSSVINQEISFFDTSKTGTGGLLQGLNQDAADIQSAISEKLGQMIKSFTTFIVGFIIAFIRGWDMTLVMLGCIPLMGLMGAYMAKTIGGE